MQNEQLHDVPGRTQSPYRTRTAVAVAPTVLLLYYLLLVHPATAGLSHPSYPFIPFRPVKLTRPPLYLALALLTQCSSCKDQDPSPEEQLPPATQTGANTFGCLVNGKAWTPKGFNGTSNYSVYYDPSYRKGTLNIGTYRYLYPGKDNVQYLTLFSDSIKSTGSYPLTILKRQEALFSDSKSKCEYHSGESHYRRGTLTITRLDAVAGIISGTFEFTLAKPGCDTIKVTQGRFDKRL